ncbi:cytochrome P450, partial [Dichomitus squalens]
YALFSILWHYFIYDQQWRKTRSAFHQCMNLAAIPRFRPVQELETKKYLLKLLRDPSGFAEHGRHLIGAIIMRVAYGIDVEEEGNHKYVKIAEDAMDVFNVVFQPGRYLVQTIPSLRHIPSWFPGVKFKRDFARWIPVVEELRDAPWEATTNIERGGHAHESIASILLDRVEDKNKDEMDTAKRAAAAACIAGADTTLSTLSTFLAAMASHPEAQKCAQKELSRVIGSDRLPTLADKEDLPYVMAIVKECMRWRSVVPLAVPHFSIEEDVYMGYRIPKGSIVLSNIWSYSRDERYYPDPEAFRPERFLTEERKLDSTVLNPSHCLRIWTEDLPWTTLRRGVSFHDPLVCSSCVQHPSPFGQRKKTITVGGEDDERRSIHYPGEAHRMLRASALIVTTKQRVVALSQYLQVRTV